MRSESTCHYSFVRHLLRRDCRQRAFKIIDLARATSIGEHWKVPLRGTMQPFRDRLWPFCMQRFISPRVKVEKAPAHTRRAYCTYGHSSWLLGKDILFVAVGFFFINYFRDWLTPYIIIGIFFFFFFRKTGSICWKPASLNGGNFLFWKLLLLLHRRSPLFSLLPSN